MHQGDEPPTILLVEDNPAHAELVERTLARAGITHRVRRVPDGEAALSYLFRRRPYADPAENPRPTLVLLDLRLPKVDGLEVLRRIKESAGLESIPVLILTTSSTDADTRRAYEHHANGFLVKPVDFERFKEMMTSLAAYWLGWNHCPRAP